MFMHRILPFFLLLVVASVVNAQNLAPNPGFETYTTCPNNLDRIAYATPWDMPTTGTTDLLNTCAATSCSTCDMFNPCVKVPTNYFGSQSPKSGSGYAGFFAYYTTVADYREYLQAALTSTLTAGTTYDVSFWVNLADEQQYAVVEIGAFFSDTPITRSDYDPFACCSPQVENSVTVLDDKNNWVQVSGSFTASGGEQYITIGNFRNNANTTTTGGLGGCFSEAYYYIDDVCVTPQSGGGCTGALPVRLIDFYSRVVHDQVKLNWQTGSEKNSSHFAVQHSPDGEQYTTIGSVTAHGTTQLQQQYRYIDTDPAPGLNYYRLKQVDQDGSYSFSKTVTAEVQQKSPGVRAVTPNPAHDQVRYTIYDHQHRVVTVHIKNVVGEVLLQQQATVREGAVTLTHDVSEWSPGIYFLQVATPEGEFLTIQQFMKQ